MSGAFLRILLLTIVSIPAFGVSKLWYACAFTHVINPIQGKVLFTPKEQRDMKFVVDTVQKKSFITDAQGTREVHVKFSDKTETITFIETPTDDFPALTTISRQTKRVVRSRHNVGVNKFEPIQMFGNCEVGSEP